MIDCLHDSALVICEYRYLTEIETHSVEGCRIEYCKSMAVCRSFNLLLVPMEGSSSTIHIY